MNLYAIFKNKNTIIPSIQMKLQHDNLAVSKQMILVFFSFNNYSVNYFFVLKYKFKCINF